MRRSFLVSTWSGVVAVLAAAPALAAPEPLDVPAATSRPADPRVRGLVARLPLSYEVNRGQAPKGFDFLVRCRGYHAYVASNEVVFAFDGAGLRMSMEDAQRVAPDTSGRTLPGQVNYFLGNDPAKWITEIPTARGAVYPEAAPGATLSFGSRDRALEFEFDLVAGVAGPRLAFEGASAITVGDDGALRLAMPHGVARISAPVAWQEVSGARLGAPARWIVEKDGAVRIDVAVRDTSRGVRIDPTVTYESYLGGLADDTFSGAALDAAGAAYLGGTTVSTNYPVVAGAYSTSLRTSGAPGAYTDGVVTKLNPAGSALVYSTYIGSTSDDTLTAMALNTAGNAYFVIITGASDYPTTSGVYRPTIPASGGGGALTELSSNGSSLAFSTFTLKPSPRAIALGASGTVFVQEELGLSRYAAGGVALDFNKKMAANGVDLRVIATDAAGYVYGMGVTSTTAGFPMTPGAFQTQISGSIAVPDVFVAKMDSSGTVVWVTLLGGTDTEFPLGIDVGLAGQPVVCGTTSSTNFPVTAGAYRTTPASGGNPDSFVTRFNSSGTALRYSSYVGGIRASKVRVHAGSSFVVAGSDGTGTVSVTNAFQSVPGGGTDGFVMKFNRDNTVAWSSYCGGSSTDDIGGIGMGPDGSIVLSGEVVSSDLPTVAPYQAAKGLGKDGFMLKIPDTLPTNIVPTAVATDTLPTWTVDYDYAVPPLSATGGIGPYVWTLVSGSLPTGASLSSSGAITGKLTQTGTFTFTVHVEDTCEIAAEKQLSIRVNPIPFITTSALAPTTIGVPYDRTIDIIDGSGTMTFSVTGGAVPPGTALSADGHLVGTPTQVGDSSFTVQVSDGRGATNSRLVSVHVNPAPSLVADVIPVWTELRPRIVQFHALSGTGAFTWTHVGGTYPASTPIDAVLGRLTGPAIAAGTYDFTLRATDAAGAFAERTFTAKLNPLPQITATALPSAAIGRPYSAQIPFTGGTPPYLWKVEGILPPGLVLNGTTGVVHGDLTGGSAGTVKFDCSDASGASSAVDVRIPTVEIADLRKKKWSGKALVADGVPQPLERYVELTAGSLLGISAKGGGQIDAGPTARLVDDAGVEVDLAPWSKSTVKSLTVKGAEIPATGRYFLTVVPAPEAKGKMSASVTIAPRAVWTGGAALTTTTTAEQRFAAPPGARIVISAKAQKGTPALPRIASLVDANGADLLAGGRVVEKGGTASFSTKVPLTGGDYRANFTTHDSGDGPITWTVSLQLPASYAFALGDVPSGD